MGQRWLEGCPTGTASTPVRSVEKGYPAARTEMSCDGMTAPSTQPNFKFKKHERRQAKAIQGAQSLYVALLAWHSDTTSDPPAGPQAEWSVFLNGVEVCDSRIPGQQCKRTTQTAIAAAPAVPTPAPAAPRSGPAPAPAAGRSTGTGFVVNRSGFVATNNHVVADCKSISVSQPSDTSLAAAVVARDAANDLALLKIAEPRYEAASFRKDKAIRPGDPIVAYGFPLAGDILTTQGNVTTGTVSALAGPGNDTRMYQITAPIQPGNSGGALLDSSGNVIGIVSSTLNVLTVAARTGNLPQNVNFAIKDSLVKAFLESNGIAYGSATSTPRKETADIGDMARKFSVLVECQR